MDALNSMLDTAVKRLGGERTQNAAPREDRKMRRKAASTADAIPEGKPESKTFGNPWRPSCDARSV